MQEGVCVAEYVHPELTQFHQVPEVNKGWAWFQDCLGILGAVSSSRCQV